MENLQENSGTKIAFYHYPMNKEYIHAICQEFNLQAEFLKEESDDESLVYIIYGDNSLKHEFRLAMENRVFDHYVKDITLND